MLHLPVELQRQCLGHLDIETLRSLRLTSKAILTLATEALFYTIKLVADDNSAKKYNALLEHEALGPLVRTVVFRTHVRTSNRSVWDNESQDEDESEDEDAFERFTDGMRAVSKLKNVREVCVQFTIPCAGPSDPDDVWGREVAETASCRSEVLAALFAGVRKAEKVDALTIVNLQDYTEESIYKNEDFQVVRARLKQLHIQVTTEEDEAAPEHDINFPSLHQFFNNDVFEHWLTPTQHQLTHLTLYSLIVEFGMWPFCDLRKVHFPRLKSLSLGKITFAHDWQVEWINSHSGTLEELILDDCPIVFEAELDKEQAAMNWPHRFAPPKSFEDKYLSSDCSVKIPLRWYHVLSQFRTRLLLLKHFALGQGDWDRNRMFAQRYEMVPRLVIERYYTFEHGSVSPWQTSEGLRDKHGNYHDWDYPYKEGDGKDLEELNMLLKVVRARARG